MIAPLPNPGQSNHQKPYRVHRFLVAIVVPITVIAAVTLVGFARHQHARKSAVARILALDGRVVYRQIGDDVDFRDDADRYADSVFGFYVGSRQRRLSDTDMKTITEFAEAEVVGLSAAHHVSQEGLKQLGRITSLDSLRIQFLRIPIREFATEIGGVSSLVLVENANGDGYGEVPADVLSGLELLPHLTSLNVQYSSVGQEHVTRISEDDNLEKLWFRRCHIHSNSLAALAKMSQLSELHLSGSEVEMEAEVETLIRLKRLQVLGLADVDVSDANLDKLKASLPGCQINR